jgi:ABC-type Zn uptake system ZnuABC Zn-binding protein ZnuA
VEKGPLKVAVSLPLLADFVQKVGGDGVEVFAILPPGAEPHTFEPTPSDVQRLSKADLVIVNGLGLEGPSQPLIENNKPASAPLVQLAAETAEEGLVTINGEGDQQAEGNPHLWLDVSLASYYVELISEALASIDPERAPA